MFSHVLFLTRAVFSLVCFGFFCVFSSSYFEFSCSVQLIVEKDSSLYGSIVYCVACYVLAYCVYFMH